MPAQSKLISRRKAMQLAVAAATAPFAGKQSFASENLLRAAIAGFSVINTLDPAKASLLSEYYVLWAAFNGLLKFDFNMQIVPDLAEEFHVVDSTTLEFRLRRGVKFQDGSDLTSDDVKFSLERLADEAPASPEPRQGRRDSRYPHPGSQHVPDHHAPTVCAASDIPDKYSNRHSNRPVQDR